MWRGNRVTNESFENFAGGNPSKDKVIITLQNIKFTSTWIASEIQSYGERTNSNIQISDWEVEKEFISSSKSIELKLIWKDSVEEKIWRKDKGNGI